MMELYHDLPCEGEDRQSRPTLGASFVRYRGAEIPGDAEQNPRILVNEANSNVSSSGQAELRSGRHAHTHFGDF